MLPHYNLVIISVPGIIMCMLLFLLHYNVCLFHFHMVLAPQLTVSHSEPDSELIVSDSELTFPHIPLIFYNIYIYHWRATEEQNTNMTIIIRSNCAAEKLR